MADWSWVGLIGAWFFGKGAVGMGKLCMEFAAARCVCLVVAEKKIGGWLIGKGATAA